MRQSNFKKWWSKAKWRNLGLDEEHARRIWDELMEEARKIVEKKKSKRGLKRLEHQRAFHKYIFG